MSAPAMYVFSTLSPFCASPGTLLCAAPPPNSVAANNAATGVNDRVFASKNAPYDYSKSTSENYADSHARIRREFFSTRCGLDYKYHGRYSLERQALQDSIIRSMLSFEDMQTGKASMRTQADRTFRGGRELKQPRQPWAIYTAGCMGSGKTHIMNRLDAHGLLPLPRFVRIDIDRIRSLLPEMEGYIARSPSIAGAMTQREAGLIAEVATEEALRRGLNLWVDSSLRDADWWTYELQRIRRTYPHRLAILHVTATWPRVVQREAKRGEVTGRRIPQDVLAATFKRVPAAVAKLREHVDEYIEIDNDARRPRLRTPRDVRALLAVCAEVGGDCESRQLESWLPGFE